MALTSVGYDGSIGEGLTVDGVLGPQAWAAAWSAPTTP